MDSVGDVINVGVHNGKMKLNKLLIGFVFVLLITLAQFVSASTYATTTPLSIGVQFETDPVYSAWNKQSGITITESQITDLDHFTSADEEDPFYFSNPHDYFNSTTQGNIEITESQISDLQSYLTSESDPDYYSNPNGYYNVTTLPPGFTDTNETTRMNEIYDYVITNRSNWDTAFSWGNHALSGYLVSANLSGYYNSPDNETDPFYFSNPNAYYNVTTLPVLTNLTPYFNYIDFNLTHNPEHSEGRIHWGVDSGGLEIDMPGGNVMLNVGEELFIRGKALENIENGQAVYISGASGDNPTLNLAQANSHEKSHLVAVATENITSGQFGYVTISGIVHEVDTSSYEEGDALYLSGDTAGLLTNASVDSNTYYPVLVGYALNSKVNGSLLVSIITFPSTDEIYNLSNYVTGLIGANYYNKSQVYNKTEVDSLLASTTYYPTSLKVTTGTINDGDNIGNISYSDNQILNVSEVVTGDGLLIYINFTGVTNTPSYLAMEHQYTGNHEIHLDVYDYNTASWETYDHIVQQSTPLKDVISLFDGDNHVFNDLVQIRFQHVGTGNINHKFYLDFINLVSGTATLTTNNHDGLSGRDNITTNHPNIIDVFYTETEIDAFNYYNISDFNIADYVTSATLSSYNYYNSSDFSISDYYTSAQIDSFNYYNSSDFNIADYVTSATLSSYNYYNSSDFSISDYYTSAQIDSFNYYNSSDFNIADYVTSSALLAYNYYNASDFDISNYYTSAQIDSFNYYNASDFDINNYYLASNPDAYYNITTLTVTESQISDLSHTVDTNETVRMNKIYPYITGTAGEALSLNEIVYLNASGEWFKTNSDSVNTATKLLGIATEACSASANCTIFISGIYTSGSFNFAGSIGQPLYLDNVDGDYTTSYDFVSGNVVRVIGHPISTTSIAFNPDGIWVVIE